MSKPEKFCVLVLDDDICLTTMVMKAIRMGLPAAEVLTARSVAEARLLLAQFKIHFFILDVNLPDGTGIHFLANLRKQFPDARVMMVTASALAKHEQATRDLGVLLFRQKPVDTIEIVKLVRAHYENMGHGTKLRHADDKFDVSLTCLSALDIIQLECVSRATLVLQVASSANGIGQICFEDGQIIHAQTPNSRGEAAFEEILRWKGGRIKQLTTAYKPPHTIKQDWQGLLLSACQRIDEHSRDEAAACVSTASAPDLNPMTEKEEAVDDDFVLVATYNGQYNLPAGTSK